ncbi:Lrp/AsnC family transcriptional regulator [Thalassotalea psychrophila]|uniref:siroheme decarboxylase n=1 Tax=Thalassotalea psychrophila TaxID=3065647 RepID=A0ABY9TUW0_9GAMM|nr:Lrp/AsnC family transcriptional regulator [Colwelliaceae bacterium SQ149]
MNDCNVTLSKLSQKIINAYQKGFPLSHRPFLELANRFNSTEDEVLECFQELQELQVLSRLGPVFNHQQAGASTLAALAVPEDQIDEIAKLVNQFTQVNHNYAREHSYNLWFVATAANEDALKQCLTHIHRETGFKPLILPMEQAYHIDLGFNIEFTESTGAR